LHDVPPDEGLLNALLNFPCVLAVPKEQRAEQVGDYLLEILIGLVPRCMLIEGECASTALIRCCKLVFQWRGSVKGVEGITTAKQAARCLHHWSSNVDQWSYGLDENGLCLLFSFITPRAGFRCPS
jgi:hypothetical protein